MLQTADKEAKQSGFYEGLFGIWYKRYMVIYLSIIGIQCKHDIILNIRRLFSRATRNWEPSNYLPFSVKAVFNQFTIEFYSFMNGEKSTEATVMKFEYVI